MWQVFGLIGLWPCKKVHLWLTPREKAIYILRGKFAKWIIDWNTMAISWQIVEDDNVKRKLSSG